MVSNYRERGTVAAGDQKKNNGCGLITLIFLIAGLIFIYNEVIEKNGFAVWIVAGIIIDTAVNLIIEKVKKNKNK
ncbi:MAG: hypothetical protein LBJ17_02665 [Dysgonamonadaceae bacterium]|jgi:hypothetical protein|nr:hypothetical protein [Dysgonamonadaceae bacterium]